MSLTVRAAPLRALEDDAGNPVYSVETRRQLAQAAAGLKAGTLKPEDAVDSCLRARLSLLTEFQTGDAFAASVPVETRTARGEYLLTQAASLIPRLRQNGLESAIAALEGARAAADFHTLGKTCVAASEALDAPPAAQPAAVFLRVQGLVEGLRAQAKPYDAHWIKTALAGDEGVHWYRRRNDYFRRTYAIPPQVTPDPQNENRVRIGCGVNMFHEILCDYAVERKGDAFKVTRMGAGFDPGDAFLISPKGAAKIGFRHLDSVPTVGSHGGLAWSSPRSLLDDDVLVKMDAKATAQLAEVLEKIAAYVASPSK